MEKSILYMERITPNNKNKDIWVFLHDAISILKYHPMSEEYKVKKKDNQERQSCAY